MAKKTKVTFRKLREIDQRIGDLFRREPGAKNSRFGVVYQKFFTKYYKKPYSGFSEALDLARVAHALEDENTGEVLFDRTPGTRGFKYDKEGLKKVIQAENKIEMEWDAKEIEIEAMYSPYVPRTLSDAEVEELVGIFFTVDQIPKPKKEEEEAPAGGSKK